MDRNGIEAMNGNDSCNTNERSMWYNGIHGAFPVILQSEFTGVNGSDWYWCVPKSHGLS